MTKLTPNSFIIPISLILSSGLGYYLLAPVYALNSTNDKVAEIIFAFIMGILIMLPVKFAVKTAISLFVRLSRP